jgi:hypothetical protein
MNLLALGTALLVVGATPAKPTPAPTTTATATADQQPEPAPPVRARPRVLVLDVSGDVDKSARDTLTALVSTRLARFSSLDIVTKAGVARLIELEGEKQATGCGDDGACLAELAGALDVDTLAVATAGRLGGTTVFTLQLVDRTGKTIGRGSTQVSALDDLGARVALVVDDVGQQVTGEQPEESKVNGADTLSPSSSSSMKLSAGSKTPLLIGGGVGAGVGAVVFAVAVTPAVLYAGVAGDLRRMRATYVDSGGDDQLLDEAVTKQRNAFALQGAWNNVGVYAAWTGMAVAALGGGALAAGLLVEEAP